MVQGMKLLEKHAGECENYIQPTTQWIFLFYVDLKVKSG
jgi:hypothetical protein